MTKIKPIAPESATGSARETMEMVQKKLGRVPKMYQVMAHSPAVLEAYTKFNTALGGGSLGSKMAELIALSTAEYNTCSYCLSAHTFLGAKSGLTDEQMTDSRTFQSESEKVQAGLTFVQKLLKQPHAVSSDDVDPLRAVGYTDGDILEIIGNVVRNMFTNYLNIVSETEVDWPVVVKPFKTENAAK
jgi:uncharacterized peroxidase-related enzyme